LLDIDVELDAAKTSLEPQVLDFEVAVLGPDGKRHEIYHNQREGALRRRDREELHYKVGALEVTIGCMIFEVILLIDL